MTITIPPSDSSGFGDRQDKTEEVKIITSSGNLVLRFSRGAVNQIKKLEGFKPEIKKLETLIPELIDSLKDIRGSEETDESFPPNNIFELCKLENVKSDSSDVYFHLLENISDIKLEEGFIEKLIPDIYDFHYNFWNQAPYNQKKYKDIFHYSLVRLLAIKEKLTKKEKIDLIDKHNEVIDNLVAISIFRFNQFLIQSEINYTPQRALTEFTATLNKNNPVYKMLVELTFKWGLNCKKAEELIEACDAAVEREFLKDEATGANMHAVRHKITENETIIGALKTAIDPNENDVRFRDWHKPIAAFVKLAQRNKNILLLSHLSCEYERDELEDDITPKFQDFHQELIRKVEYKHIALSNNQYLQPLILWFSMIEEEKSASELTGKINEFLDDEDAVSLKTFLELKKKKYPAVIETIFQFIDSMKEVKRDFGKEIFFYINNDEEKPSNKAILSWIQKNANHKKLIIHSSCFAPLPNLGKDCKVIFHTETEDDCDFSDDFEDKLSYAANELARTNKTGDHDHFLVPIKSNEHLVGYLEGLSRKKEFEDCEKDLHFVYAKNDNFEKAGYLDYILYGYSGENDDGGEEELVDDPVDSTTSPHSPELLLT